MSPQQQEHSPQRSKDTGATQVQDEPQLHPIVPSQPKEGEIPQASIPPTQEEPTSPSIQKKHKKRIKIQMKKRKRISIILVPKPSIHETIPEGDEEEEEIESEEEE